MNDDRYKRYFEAIQRELNNWLIDYKILGVDFSKGALAAKLHISVKDFDGAKNAVMRVFKSHIQEGDYGRIRTSGDRQHITIIIKSAEPWEEPVAMGIPFSSPDEAKGTAPIEMAQELVRAEIDKHLNYTEYTTYVPFFAYILGGYKATVSTTIADGRYYEVTYNKEADEFYVDTYKKERNTVFRNHQEEEPDNA